MDSPELRALMAKYEVTKEDFDLGEVIGEGGFGRVYIGIHKKTGKRSAVKQLTGRMDDVGKKDFEREVTILAQCNDMFLLPFYGFSIKNPYLIVTEFMPGGSLYKAERHRKHNRLTGTNKTIIALGVAYGLAALHKKHIIHRDLKSLNVLLDENYYPRICDFGISKIKSEDDQFMTQDVGTPIWMAPELFTSVNYTNKVDVYAYAILLWEMFYGKSPFKGVSSFEVMSQVTSGKRPPLNDPKHEQMPEHLQELIQACWNQDPERRPSFEQIAAAIDKYPDMYPGTDPKAVRKIVKKYRIDCEERLIIGNVPPLYADEDEFVKELPTLLASITTDNAESIFVKTGDQFKPAYAKGMIDAIRPHMLKYPRATVNSHILEKLPLFGDAMEHALQLLITLAKEQLLFLTPEVLHAFTQIILNGRPISYLKILYLLLSSTDPTFKVIGAQGLARCADMIIEQDAGQYWLQMVNYALKDPTVLSQCGEQFITILINQSGSRNPEIAHDSFVLGWTHFRGKFILSEPNLEQRLAIVPEDVMTYLIVCPRQISSNLLGKILDVGANPKGVLVALISQQVDVILAKLPYLLASALDDENKLRLCMSVIIGADVNIYVTLIKMPEFLRFFSSMSSRYFDVVSRVFLKYLGTTYQIAGQLDLYNSQFVRLLNEAGFFHIAFASMKSIDKAKYCATILQKYCPAAIRPNLEGLPAERVYLFRDFYE